MAGIALLALAPSALAQQQTIGPQEQAGVEREDAVVNGTEIQISAAPWQVFTRSDNGNGSFSLCGGSIFDADTIITAAHCVFGEDPDASDTGNGPLPPPARDPASFDVLAGISNFRAPEPGDDPQQVAVASIRVHPGYDPNAGDGSPDDVATLELANPLTIGTATAQAIPLSTAPPAIGSGANLTGFGQQDPDANPNGDLFSLNTTVQNPLTCGGPANALYVCIVSATGSACRGDSGGPMTQANALIGVASFVTGPNANEICRARSLNGYANSTAGEISQFIAGDDTPALAPRGGEDVSGQGRFEVGGTLTCNAGTWSNSPTFKYTIIDTRNGRFLQDGPSNTYRFKEGDEGAEVACFVSATTAGGTGVALTEAGPPVTDPTPDGGGGGGDDGSGGGDDGGDGNGRQRRPRLVVAVAAGRRAVRAGGRVAFRIRVSNRGRRIARRVRVCANPSRGLAFSSVPRGANRRNGRVCFTFRSVRARGSRTVRIVMRTARSRRTRTVRLRVGARARNARRLRRDSAAVRVRGRGGAAPAPPAVTGRYRR